MPPMSLQGWIYGVSEGLYAPGANCPNRGYRRLTSAVPPRFAAS